MDRAEEIFTMQLARAAGKTANKFLHARGLQKADRNDVISAALLWCWENRANYSLTTTLETWFMNAVRHAHRDLKRGELPLSDESIDQMASADPTFDAVAAESAAKALMEALTPADRKIAALIAEGYTRREIMKMGIDQYRVDSTYARIKQLRRLVPDESRSKRLIQTMVAAVSDDAGDQLSGIDAELERLEFAPPAGKDCPPCWRCMWFEGFMPADKRSTRMDIEDLEVREAVNNN